MSPATLDVDHLRSWIGRQEATKERLEPELVRRFNATFDADSNCIEDGSVAPRLIHFCLGHAAAPTASLGDDGHPQRGGFLPAIPLPRRMAAGGRLEFSGELRVGDLVRRTSKVADLSVKEGRSGTLCFVAVDHVIDVDGQVMVTERQDIVYREADTSSGQVVEVRPCPQGQYDKLIRPTPTLLFRYSAITFNSHRIHYDDRYAREIEGYPGRVVHGPMQATLLLRLATEIKGSAPRQFAFRNQSPLFDNTDFHLHAENDGHKLRLWSARDGGPIAMTAEASW